MATKKTLGKWQVFSVIVFVVTLTFNIFVIAVEFFNAYQFSFDTTILHIMFTLSGLIALVWWLMIKEWRKRR